MRAVLSPVTTRKRFISSASTWQELQRGWTPAIKVWNGMDLQGHSDTQVIRKRSSSKVSTRQELQRGRIPALRAWNSGGWTCKATLMLKSTHQEEEQHSDPHIHAKSPNADPEDDEEHNPEFQAQSQQIQVQQYSCSNSSPEIHNTQEEFNANLDSTKHSEITTDPELLPQKSTPAKLFTENFDLHWEAKARGATDLAQVIMVQRPPPEPLDLKSLLEELFTMRMPAGQNVIDDAEKENRANRGVKDGAIAKGKVVDIGSADLTRGSSAVVGAFAEGMWTAAGRTTTATVADRGLRARQLRRFVLLTPPPLTTVVFLWSHSDEEEEWSRVVVEGRILLPAAAEVRRGGDSDEVPSVFDSRNSRKGGV
ncbi:hypothetical protein PIB30_057984 [Stylosanthes scabra]|uniref:Uncharacterized protein n=1 Tax=Stylosanthes scabra TaxID=79078 RepID=A0ABU6UIK8_9FABA|nr:hypothetical protein [Stylosanthes scabra]